MSIHIGAIIAVVGGLFDHEGLPQVQNLTKTLVVETTAIIAPFAT